MPVPVALVTSGYRREVKLIQGRIETDSLRNDCWFKVKGNVK